MTIDYRHPETWAADSRWLSLRAPDGQEGWVDAKVAEITWAL